MTERVLIIKEAHLASLFTEWARRYEADPEAFFDLSSTAEYGEVAADFTFNLAKEMGYVSY